MLQDIAIRTASPEDVEGLSDLIQKTLSISNAKDYSSVTINRIIQAFEPSAIRLLLTKRTVFVAVTEKKIIGTASLEGYTIRSVFVDPDFQGKETGRRLIDQLEDAAIRSGVTDLEVPASLTAEPFYARLGFTPVRDAFYGEERTVIMKKRL